MRNLKIDDFTRFNFLSNGKFNSNGNVYAYIVKKANLGTNTYDSNLFIYDLKNGVNKQLTFSNKVGFYQWLNDQEIIFIFDENSKETSSVYLININGGESRPYLKIEKNINDFKIINNDLIAFTALNKISIDDENDDNKDYQIIDEIPFWQNGKGFTNKSRNALYIINKNDNEIKMISGLYSDVMQYEVKDNLIYFSANTFSNRQELFSELYMYELDQNKTYDLLEEKNHELYKFLIINDQIYIFAVDTNKYGVNENSSLYKIKDSALSLVWSKDEEASSNVGSDSKLGSGIECKVYDNYIYYTVLDRDKTIIKKIDLLGNEKIIVENFSSIDFFDVVNDKIIFCATEDLSLQELYLLSSNEISKLTSINDNVISDVYLSPIEHFIFKNDGIDLDGYLIKPVNFDSNKKYPCILDIHGGPKTAYGRNYYHEMQLFANNGYYLVFCNPRGSDGRGNDFADIRGKYGTIDYDDLMKCLDTAIINNKNIDTERLGVTGGSYGGFMTNWIIGHTNRFKAAVSQRSISNWISMFSTTDIGYYFADDQNLATPWSDYEKLWWHSPLKYADNVHTPTLFIHSDEDYRCWIAEGIQMFTALKYHGVDARMCIFKGENHELSRSGKPLHRIKRLQEILSWFDKYLK